MSDNGLAVIEDETVDELENELEYEAFIGKNGEYFFRTSTGIVLEVMGVPPSLSKRYLYAYRMSHPEPSPPQHEIKRARKMVWVDNPKDVYFRQQMDNWNIDFSVAISDFFIRKAVISQPPKDFKVDPEILELYGDVNDEQRKVIWVESLLVTEGENEAFFEAIRSIYDATEAAIEESTATFPSPSKRKGR